MSERMMRCIQKIGLLLRKKEKRNRVMDPLPDYGRCVQLKLPCFLAHLHDHGDYCPRLCLRPFYF